MKKNLKSRRNNFETQGDSSDSDDSVEEEADEEEDDNDIIEFQKSIRQGVEDYSFKKGDMFQYDDQTGEILQKHREPGELSEKMEMEKQHRLEMKEFNAR